MPFPLGYRPHMVGRAGFEPALFACRAFSAGRAKQKMARPSEESGMVQKAGTEPAVVSVMGADALPLSYFQLRVGSRRQDAPKSKWAQRSECGDHEFSEESRVGSARRDLPQKSLLCRSETTKAALAGGLERRKPVAHRRARRRCQSSMLSLVASSSVHSTYAESIVKIYFFRRPDVEAQGRAFPGIEHHVAPDVARA